MKLDPREWSRVAWLNIGYLAVGVLAIVVLDGLAFWLVFEALLITKLVVERRWTRTS